MDWQLAWRVAVTLAAAYLLGGIPWALIIGKRFYHIDVREHGSGNLGATNVFRTLGAKAAVATAVLDAAKGALAVGIAVWLVPTYAFGALPHEWAMIAATLAAMLGHSYSPYAGFHGGKGVATAAGALLVVTPLAWPFLFGTFLIVIVVTRMVSLGSVLVALEYPVLCLLLYRGEWPVIIFSTVAAALVLWRHRTNIVRIVRGQEPKISLSKRGSAAREKGDS